DSGSFVFDEEGWVTPRDGSRQDLYVFAYGRGHVDAVRALYEVSGQTPLLPRWALGNWWSRYHPYSADSYEQLLDRFDVEGLPFSVAVLDMDWHLLDVEPRYGSGWTGYTWNRELFPDPPAFLRRLHERGLHVTLNVHPADGVRPFEEAHPDMAAALGHDPDAEEAIAFDVTDRAFMEAYFQVLHRRLEQDGVDFWWVDWQSGPYSRVAGIDPLWMLNHFHYLDNARGGRRGLTFSRYAGPGSHRYPIGFSGDTVISWASLDFQPYFTATAANIGYGWWSHDIGGHLFGAKDDELATRWVQLGVFSPILRLHSTNDPFTTKEPWSFGIEAQGIQTRYLRLRHRLVPYLHTMNYRAASGVPLIRPPYHQWPNAPEAYRHGNEYLFGDLLVAPVTAPRDRGTLTGRVPVWLPEGEWVDVLSDRVYDGGREMVMHRPLDTLPVLARAGAIVPLDAADVPSGECGNPESLEVLVVAGADGSFELLEDDGTGARPEEARVARTSISYSQSEGRIVIGPVSGALDAIPERRQWTVTLVMAARQVADGIVATVDGSEVPVQVRETDVLGAACESPTRVSLTVTDVPATARLDLVLAHPAALAPNDVEGQLYRMLDAAQVDYRLKTRIFAIATSEAPLHVRLSHIHALSLTEALAEAVDDILLAHVH
ncbi:MAG: glycoside hydrolase family 31 protein, partial [Actinomycetales bacterium]